MRRMVTVIVLLSSFACMPGKAHCGTPYSANGLGFVIPDDVGISRSLGGAGIAIGEGINMMRGNPALMATYSSPSYSVATIYDRINTYTGGTEKLIFAKTNLSLIRFILPVGKGIVMGWGISPYSRTDVTINLESNPGDIFQDEMKTTGGINVSSFGISASLRKRFYYGIALNYHFGAIEENWKRTFPDNPEMHVTTDYLKKKYKGYSTTLGIMVNPFKKTYVGLGYTTKASLNLNVILRPGNPLNPEVPVYSRNTSLPATLRLGVSSVLGSRLIAAFDYSLEQWEDAAETDKEKKMYNNSYRFGGGVRFIPSTRYNAPYYLTLPISAGFKFGTLYYKSYPEIDTVSEKAITFGLEFPLMKNAGRLFSSFEYGVRGDKDRNGWDETYMSFGLLLMGRIK